MPIHSPSRDRAFPLIVAAFLAYSVFYILRTSVVVDGVRYFLLADDEMISMRYAANLAAGHGLVWNPGGPRIEGFTNPLWVLYMALVHWIGVPKPWTSACIQFSGAALLAVTLVYVRRIAEQIADGSAAAGLLAAALTAFYVPLANWAFQGTEVSLLTLAVTALTWLALQHPQDARWWMLALLTAATTLVRPDMVVFAAAMFAALAAAEPQRWRRHLLGGAAVVGAFLALETALRIWYFGDPLPNTAYLKLTGVPLSMRLTRGVFVSISFLVDLAPLLWLVHRLRDRPAPWSWRVPAVVFGAQLAYSAWVGGDAWEWWGGSNRFVAIAMPLFFALVAAAVVRLPGLAAPRRIAWAAAACICLANVPAFVGSAAGSPVQRMLLTSKPPETAADAAHLRAALALRRFTDPDAVIAVVWAGTIPYFSERTAIDLLGKMDPRIARGPAHVPAGPLPWLFVRPGHMKWDYAYSIGELQPDVIESPLWPPHDGTPPIVARDYVARYDGGAWYVRRDSRHVASGPVPAVARQ